MTRSFFWCEVELSWLLLEDEKCWEQKNVFPNKCKVTNIITHDIVIWFSHNWTSFIDFLELFMFINDRDPNTKSIIMIGEIGGEAKVQAADYRTQLTMPRQWSPSLLEWQHAAHGHAGAIISQWCKGFAGSKIEALERSMSLCLRVPLKWEPCWSEKWI